MPFKKGMKKIGGKAKGVKNTKTLLWENLGDFFIGEGAERALGIMKSSPNKEFMIYYTDLIELFKPKQSRVESTISVDENITEIARTVIHKNVEP